jgi:hypothetical protein
MCCAPEVFAEARQRVSTDASLAPTSGRRTRSATPARTSASTPTSSADLARRIGCAGLMPRSVYARSRASRKEVTLIIRRQNGPVRSIDVQVLRLRRKLEHDPSAPQIIQTERRPPRPIRADIVSIVAKRGCARRRQIIRLEQAHASIPGVCDSNDSGVWRIADFLRLMPDHLSGFEVDTVRPPQRDS